MAENVEALNGILDTYSGRCKRLENISRAGVLRLNRVDQAQEIYVGVTDLAENLNARLLVFENDLPIDDEGDQILPVNGQEGYRFRPENIGDVYDRIEATQKAARKALIKFKHEQDPEDDAQIKAAAICDFLKENDV